MKKNIIYCNPFILLLLLTGTIGSCKKFVDVAAPPTKIETPVIFDSDPAAVSATVGLYSRMLQTSSTLINGGTTLYTGLSSDELINTSTNLVADAFRSNSLTPTMGTLPTSFWSSPYNQIYQANAVLEGLAKSKVLTDSLQKQLRGEMLVTRSFLYFYLINLFGDVPLITTTDYRINLAAERTPVETIYENLVKDLSEAQGLLKENYPSLNRFRPNRYTATALLSRIYLYMKNYIAAGVEATKIIQSGKYSLSSINAVFTAATSPETIWQLMRDNNNTQEGSLFIPSSATVKPAYIISPELLNSFEPGDLRKTITTNGWMGKNTISGTDYFYPFKYKLRTLASGSQPTEFLILFRLAEIYLIRAEASAASGNLPNAIADINLIRVRAGLSQLPLTLTASQVLTAIQHERCVEFFAEWGHRWLDLKRLDKASAVLEPIKSPNWQSTDILYPIPQAELLLNPVLVQNAGY